MAIIDVVKWEGAPNVFAYKFPNSQLNTKAQLVVNESQEAVFVHEGKYFGPFTAGRHTLSTNNLPFLTSIATTFLSGGATPFTAEVWFIQKAMPLNILWGTTDPVLIEDPVYHIILPVRAFGQYGVKIVNSMKFLGKLVGQLPAFTEKTLSSYLKGVIITSVKTEIGKVLTDKNVCLLKLAGHMTEISEQLQEHLSSKIEEYGLQVVSFNVNSISVSEEDPSVKKLKDALAKRAEMDILGYTYQQERSFDTMETAAGNTGAGGSLMNAGIGMGMGLGAGMPMGAAMGSMARSINTDPTVKCPKCSAQVAQGVRFCPECGSPMQQPSGEKIKCPKCGSECAAGMKFCASCGAKLEIVCPNCKQQVKNGMKFCPNCGTTLA